MYGQLPRCVATDQEEQTGNCLLTPFPGPEPRVLCLTLDGMVSYCPHAWVGRDGYPRDTSVLVVESLA